jgi:Tfp pilus assembly protein PilN
MRAVNLIPAEHARATGHGGRSGGGAYVVLGVLALAVVMVGVWTYLDRTVERRQAEVAQVRAAADAAEAKAGSLKAYTDFAALRKERTETVRQLADSRFDWPHALREVSRTIPARVWLGSLRATVNQTVAVDGTPDPLRAALPQPAIELAACTDSQRRVARTIAAMRSVDDVQRVSLSSSTRANAGESAGDCGEGGGKLVSFSMTVFFKTPSGQSAGTTAGGAATTASATTEGTTP